MAKDSTKALLRTIDGLKADSGRLEREQDNLRTELRDRAFEHDQLRYLLGQADRHAKRAEHDLKDARARLRKAETRRKSRTSFEIVTGLAPQQPSRGVHQLRTGTGG